MAFSSRVCVPTSSVETNPPVPILNLLLPPSFSHHNIVFISPLRLNPSLPVHCGKRHFENEIGYINSSTITLAIAFPLYSSSETWLTSSSTPTFLTKCKGKRQHMGLALSAQSNWEEWGEGNREDYLLFIWTTHGRRLLPTHSWAHCKLELVGWNKWSLRVTEQVLHNIHLQRINFDPLCQRPTSG